jgi:hypothetical protein
MIKIVKMEYSGNPAIMTETVTHKPVDFYELTALDRTEKDFADDFRAELSSFGKITRLTDEGTHIRINFSRENDGFLFVYPEPDKKPEKKRPTKNLESLIQACNDAQYIVDLSQHWDENGIWWFVQLRPRDLSDFEWSSGKTPYKALKEAILKTNGRVKLC